MAIVDYERIAQTARNWFYGQTGVSEKNKALVRRYELGYHVKPARKALFYKHIAKLLERTDDLERDMHDRDTINRIYADLEASLGANYYATVLNTGKALARWLNEGETPKGFLDLKSVKKKRLQRGLRREDMLSWEDGLTVAAQSPSLQLKAIILTQLDGGFRPSEFIDLNYGDIEVKGDVIVANVHDGKTGGRHVTLWRCVPHLLKWLQAHPSKKPKDPLWVMEHADKSHRKGAKPENRFSVRRYDYFALRKAVLRLGEKAEIGKPMDFYALRHSSCFLDKLDNLPLDIAAKKHGHSVAFFTDTYGRLDVDDDVNRLRQHYGGEEEERTLLRNRKCARCNFVNEPDVDTCQQCGSSLTVDAALKREDELRAMKDQMNHMAQMLARIESTDTLRAALKIKRG